MRAKPNALWCPTVSMLTRHNWIASQESNVREIRQVLRRLARPQRHAETQVIQDGTRGAQVRSRTARTRPPKTEGARKTITQILCAYFKGREKSQRHEYYAAKALIASAGSSTPRELSAAHVMDVCESWEKRYRHVTRVNAHGALRRVLRWLWEEHGAPKLDSYVPKLSGTRPRNVTADRDTINRLIEAARPDMRLWILLCSDLGIRSGTALKLGPDNYNRRAGTLSFTTKKAAALTLPLTSEAAELIESCDMGDPRPFVTQLREEVIGNHGRPRSNAALNSHNMRQEFAKLRTQVGITKRVTLHDLRRTTAVAIYKRTRDLHIVQAFLGHRNMQATIWYLDHDLQPVERSTLEDAKKPFLAWRKEQTA